MQPVKVALAEGQVTILDSGPAPGANVVVDGADRLRPGQLVTVSAARAQAAGSTAQPNPAPAGQGKSNGGQSTKEQQ